MFFWKPRPVLDEESVLWLFDTFAWALENFNTQNRFAESRLVLPSNEYFPGKEHSPEAMATLIFSKVVEYAGMGDWPVQLVTQNQMDSLALAWDGPLDKDKPGLVLPVLYNPAQTGNPQAFIATLAHALAMYQGSQAIHPPPGGGENWPHITEVLAVYLGVGIVMANSAFNVRVSSCGSCQGPSHDRESFLSQYDITYALAIYSVLKDLNNKQVLQYLKKSLHAYYRKAVKEVCRRSDEMRPLRQLHKDRELCPQ